MDTSLDWNVAGTLGLLPARQGSIAKTRSEWDAIVGVKGEIALCAGKWFMPYYLDVGGGSHNTTWQALVGAGYRYGWGELVLSVAQPVVRLQRQRRERRRALHRSGI